MVTKSNTYSSMTYICKKDCFKQIKEVTYWEDKGWDLSERFEEEEEEE